MQDVIIQEVEEAREQLARRFDYDVRKIAAYLRARGQRRRMEESGKKTPNRKASPQESV